MKDIAIPTHPAGASPSIRHAAILAAPLWASGFVFLAVLFAITRHGEFFSLQFLAMSVVVFLGSTIAALRVMDRELTHSHMHQSPDYRRMKMRAKRLHATRLI